MSGEIKIEVTGLFGRRLSVYRECQNCKGSGSVVLFEEGIADATTIYSQFVNVVCNDCDGKGAIETGEFVIWNPET